MNSENVLFPNWEGNNLELSGDSFGSPQEMETALRDVVAQSGMFISPSLWDRFEFAPRVHSSFVNQPHVFSSSRLVKDADDATIHRELLEYQTPFEDFVLFLKLHASNPYASMLMTTGRSAVYNIIYIPGKNSEVVTVALSWGRAFRSWAVNYITCGRSHPSGCVVVHPAR